MQGLEKVQTKSTNAKAWLLGELGNRVGWDAKCVESVFLNKHPQCAHHANGLPLLATRTLSSPPEMLEADTKRVEPTRLVPCHNRVDALVHTLRIECTVDHAGAEMTTEEALKFVTGMVATRLNQIRERNDEAVHFNGMIV